MKKLYVLLLVLLVQVSFGQSPFISEISYVGTSNQMIEISGAAGTDISGWQLIFYGNNNRKEYESYTIEASTVIDNEGGSGYGALSFTMPFDIRDEANSGIALVNGTVLIQFIAWGGVFRANKGPANGQTATDVGVIQTNASNPLQLLDGGWVVGSESSFGTKNSGLTLAVVKNQIENFKMYPNPVTNSKLTITSANTIEKQIEIYSMVGKLVYSKKILSNKLIDISGLDKGIYLLRVIEDGKIATRKLVIN